MFKKKEYIYPKYWDEDDKNKFKLYMKDSKELYPDMLDHFLEVCCERQVNEDKGILKPLDHSKIVDLNPEIEPYELLKTEIEVDN